MYGEGNQGGGFRPRGGPVGFAPVKVGEEIDVRIEAIGEKGDGIARKRGFILFVPNTKEGQEVKIRVTKVLRKVGFAEVVGEASGPVETAQAPPQRDSHAAPEPVPEPEPAPEDSDDFGEEEAVPEEEAAQPTEPAEEGTEAAPTEEAAPEPVEEEPVEAPAPEAPEMEAPPEPPAAPEEQEPPEEKKKEE